MKRRLVILLVVLGALGMCYGLAARLAPMPIAARPAPAQARKPAASPAASLPAKEEAAGFDEVTVKVEIGPASDYPEAWRRGHGCAHTILSRVLGAQVGSGNGCPVISLEPGKAADKAGIRVRDRLGYPEDCASSLYGYFAPGPKARTVTWTVRRPRTTSAPSPSEPAAAAKPSALPQRAR